MKLDQKEARLIAELRATPTGKITTVKYAGEIKSIRTEIDAEIADKARGVMSALSPASRGTLPGETTAERKIVPISEPRKTNKTVAGVDGTPIQE